MKTHSNKPRVLLITRNLPPLVGGMERLNWHMADELSQYGEVRVIGPAGSAAQRPARTQVVEVPLKPLWRFLLQAGWQAIRLARQWRPDVVIAGSGLTAPLALIAARLCKARAVAYVHGLDLAVTYPLYRALWLPALCRLDQVIANSRPTAELARRIGVSPERTSIVHPGVAMPAAEQDTQSIQRFRDEYALGERPILLSVGRLTTRKGLCEFVEHALPRIVAKQPDALLVVIGDAPREALRAEAQLPESIQSQADAVGVGGNLRFLGVITEREKLSAAYRAAAVHVFPVRHLANDPEGFGMVAVEAAAHGLPTVAFATGGIVDAVAHNRSGYLIQSGDYPAFASAVLDTLEADGITDESCAEFARTFAWDNFGRLVSSALQLLDSGS